MNIEIKLQVISGTCTVEPTHGFIPQLHINLCHSLKFLAKFSIPALLQTCSDCQFDALLPHHGGIPQLHVEYLVLVVNNVSGCKLRSSFVQPTCCDQQEEDLEACQCQLLN